MKLTRQQVYGIIDGEREYQERRWNRDTTTSSGLHSPAEWLVYMQSYLTEAIDFAARGADPVSAIKVMENIRKITAMGVCAMEQNDCLSRMPLVTPLMTPSGKAVPL